MGVISCLEEGNYNVLVERGKRLLLGRQAKISRRALGEGGANGKGGGGGARAGEGRWWQLLWLIWLKAV